MQVAKVQRRLQRFLLLAWSESINNTMPMDDNALHTLRCQLLEDLDNLHICWRQASDNICAGMIDNLPHQERRLRTLCCDEMSPYAHLSLHLAKVLSASMSEVGTKHLHELATFAMGIRQAFDKVLTFLKL